MGNADKNTKKEFYTIGEVAQVLNFSPDTLRFYEKTDVIGPIRRNRGGTRQYTQENLDWLLFVRRVKLTGMPLDEIRLYRELVEQGPETSEQRRELMIRHQNRLQQQITELNLAMELISYKIQYYDEVMKDYSFQ